MKIIVLLLPIFVFAGLNNSYAYKKGYQEGIIISHSLFGKILSQKEINNKCLKAWEKDSDNNYVKQNKDTFLKGCEAALSSGF